MTLDSLPQNIYGLMSNGRRMAGLYFTSRDEARAHKRTLEATTNSHSYRIWSIPVGSMDEVRLTS